MLAAKFLQLVTAGSIVQLGLWDFESGWQGWTKTGSWLHGYDAGTFGTNNANGVRSGTKALYTYTGNYASGKTL